MPIAIAAVDMKGYDTQQLSDFVKETLLNELEGTTGVASINTGGLIESKINVSISEEKIEAINEKLLRRASESLADAKAQINTGLTEVKKAEAQLADARTQLDATREGTYDQLAGISAELDAAVAQASAFATQIKSLEYVKNSIKAQIEESPLNEDLKKQLDEIDKELSELIISSQEADAQVEQLKAAYKEAEKGTYVAQDSLDAAYGKLETAQSELISQ